jgi:hypothetical protein
VSTARLKLPVLVLIWGAVLMRFKEVLTTTILMDTSVLDRHNLVWLVTRYASEIAVGDRVYAKVMNFCSLEPDKPSRNCRLWLR